MKAVDAESDEQAAKFDVLQELLTPNTDFLLFVGWTWMEHEEDGIKWEAPYRDCSLNCVTGE